MKSEIRDTMLFFEFYSIWMLLCCCCCGCCCCFRVVGRFTVHLSLLFQPSPNWADLELGLRLSGLSAAFIASKMYWNVASAERLLPWYRLGYHLDWFHSCGIRFQLPELPYQSLIDAAHISVESAIVWVHLRVNSLPPHSSSQPRRDDGNARAMKTH